ncbi:hypothetical protein NDU88_003940 [Pleurodeles waltl]|uniref:Uncharacterized protein n=1 Tax=Pleurodeles waltl TaxID=8319 RepID=A0AAV7TQ12_PLEWA|nr:hypothetical protein NDU88_003940 [Pleurodeles waltl]
MRKGGPAGTFVAGVGHFPPSLLRHLACPPWPSLSYIWASAASDPARGFNRPDRPLLATTSQLLWIAAPLLHNQRDPRHKPATDTKSQPAAHGTRPAIRPRSTPWNAGQLPWTHRPFRCPRDLTTVGGSLRGTGLIGEIQGLSEAARLHVHHLCRPSHAPSAL